jgi:hypothetical protein
MRQRHRPYETGVTVTVHQIGREFRDSDSVYARACVAGDVNAVTVTGFSFFRSVRSSQRDGHPQIIESAINSERRDV